MKIFIEEYKGYEIFFNKDEEKFEFKHDILGLVQCTFLRLLKEDIDKYSESKFISPVRACCIIYESRYIDVLGFSQNGSYIVKYKDSSNIVNMVSTAGKQYYLPESQEIVDDIKKCEEQIKYIKEHIEKLKSSIKTIESLKL